ncbi:chromosome alignment-maintaining phosphoprotein 1 [Kryptolebias marmoratus]|uniref:chromosome alignment-maintaining phosphoprotein 1 n=1 Tax=Kryptolebias marmoratus TaxID=37003 RepID=UPI0007F887DF|nr:chromosome alignment-maintaining phosphoprotein 1 [Kryptolebias marmoratus]XP_037829812.1 chromosome alignment-maintaining phosphoprotein 1 [Kryptolebias marmoratus]
MSVIIHTRGETGGGMAAHLQCSHCGHFSRSHAQQLSHMAASHPTCLDNMAMGRLGNILMYQSSGRLFHCSICFYTSRDFSKLYKHIVTKHCMYKKEEGEAGEGREEGSAKGEEEEGVKEAPKRKSSEEEGEAGEGREEGSAKGEEEEGVKEAPKRKSSEEEGGAGEGREEGSAKGEEEEGVKEAPKRKSSEEEGGAGEGREEGSAKGEEEEGVKEAPKRKSSEEEGGAGEGREEGSAKGEEEEGVKEAPKRKSSEEEGGAGEGREEGSAKGEEEADNEEVKDAPKRKRINEEEEKEQSEEQESVKPKDEEKKNILMFDGVTYCCLICGWRTKQKAVSVSHLVRKHDLPKTYAAQVIRRDVASISQSQGGVAEDEEGPGLSKELLKEEIEATAKVVSYISSRFVCLICGWKTKLKGFAISHVVRCHDVKCPYRCKECSQSFFLPSQLQHHVRAIHRPGRYACPFCWFRSEYLGGFRRHCSSCGAREEEGGEGTGGGGGGGGGGEDEEEEEAWKQESSERSIKEEHVDDD